MKKQFLFIIGLMLVYLAYGQGVEDCNNLGKSVNSAPPVPNCSGELTDCNKVYNTSFSGDVSIGGGAEDLDCFNGVDVPGWLSPWVNSVVSMVYDEGRAAKLKIESGT